MTQVRPEVVQMVEGRLFDLEFYERTDAWNGSLPSETGFYVIIRASDAREAREEVQSSLVGPFPSAALAMAMAKGPQAV